MRTSPSCRRQAWLAACWGVVFVCVVYSLSTKCIVSEQRTLKTAEKPRSPGSPPPTVFPCPDFRFGRRHHSPSSPAGNHVGEGGLWRLGDALRSRRVDLDGGGRARGAVAGRRQPPSTSRRRLSKAGGIIGCCSQAAADKDMNNIPAQAVAARAAAGGAISTHSRHRCTCVLPLPPNSAPLSSTRAHPIICSQADCGVCCAMPTHQTLARA